jgi:hypothetical protein
MSDEKSPRMDVPFERLHQRMVAAVIAYEQAMSRKRVRVEKIVITYDAAHEPYYNVQIQEKKLEPMVHKNDPVPPPAESCTVVAEDSSEADDYEEITALESN